MVLNLQGMIYKLASITKQITGICTLMQGSPENLVVREKFKVTNDNLFPCQADPQKFYIFPVVGVLMLNRRRFSMVTGASGKLC